MEAQAVATQETPRSRAGSSRMTTLGVMGVTAAIIFAVAFLANQPAAAAPGVTAVTITGAATGEAPEVGRAAPDFTATTVDGNAVKLSDFKGQAVWLTFGASWCQPCRAESPDIQRTYDKLKADGVVVLQVFISEDAATVKDYATRVGLTYPKVADPNTQIASEYRILGIPSHFFIDRSGVLSQITIGSLDIPAMEAAVAKIAR
jgi:cytochrome c biogenesis protein CcmG, thiol:disulfide interchange protein DsbE